MKKNNEIFLNTILSDSNSETLFYYINDRNNNKRWIFPASLKYPTFLNLYNTSSLKGMIYKIILKIIFKCNLQKFFVSGSFFSNLNKKYLKVINDFNCENYSIFTGTVGINRKIIIEINENTKTKYFIKIPITPNSNKLIINEKLNLEYLSNFNFKGFEIPSFFYNNYDILVLNNISPPKNIKDDKFSDIHLKALIEIYKETSKKMYFNDIEYFNTISKNINDLKKNNINISLKSKISSLIEKISIINDIMNKNEGRNIIDLSFSHMDFTPWNMYITKDNLHIYDWELSEDKVPLLFDFFHYIFQRGILIKHKKYSELIHEINYNLTNQNLIYILDNYKIDFNKYYIFYLLKNISYYLLKYIEQDSLHVQAIWLIDVWTEAVDDLILKKGIIFDI